MGREAQTQSYTDERNHGWYMVYRSATAMIREHFAGRPEGLTTATALAVYGAICELVNEQRSHDAPIYRKALAERSGIGLKAASNYQAALETAGVIRVERRQIEGVNLPNIVHVLTTDDVVSSRHYPGRDDARVGSSEPQGSGREDTPMKNGALKGSGEETEEARAGARKSVVYRGHRVPSEAVESAERLLGVFAEATGKSSPAWTGKGEPTPGLKQVIGAMRVRETVTAGEWEAAIRSTVASPPGWAADRPLQLGDVFGERAAEHALAAGRGEGGNGRAQQRGGVPYFTAEDYLQAGRELAAEQEAAAREQATDSTAEEATP